MKTSIPVNKEKSQQTDGNMYEILNLEASKILKCPHCSSKTQVKGKTKTENQNTPKSSLPTGKAETANVIKLWVTHGF